ncbi:MAG: Alcohol dehydrogenase GroES domain protein [Planctomycetaceae bacterium]|nr:Alcohol dehydrogenase GroES domain protein [Planctomycetaceae bacterium]
MKAIQLEKPGKFDLIQIPEATSPGPGEALVRVHRVGICGTDISGFLGKMPFYSYPRIPGHELGVEVLEVGSGVTQVQPGDRCSIEPYINNESSFASQRGSTNCCEDLKVLGVHIDGGMRPRFLVPARKLHPSESLTFEQLALVETLAIGCHAVNRGQAQAGENVLVIGAGPIGLSAIEFLRIAKSKITVLDVNQQRLDFCKHTMKVDHTVKFEAEGGSLSALQNLTDGHLYTLVVDATGNSKSMSNALNYVGHTGRLVYVGITTEEVHFPHPLMHRREMTLLASRNALPADFTRIIKLIQDGKIDTRPWITHRSSMESLIADFPSYTKPETGVIKAIVEIEG